MRPSYYDNFLVPIAANRFFEYLLTIPWLRVRENRQEYFMAETPTSYTYGRGDQAKEYRSEPFTDHVARIMGYLNETQASHYNACFLNRYDTQRDQLGWHADDEASMDPNHSIAVLSLGAEREIWWKPKDYKGEIPPEQRQLLKHGSIFIMPAGFQATHYHRIPKCDRPIDTRISLTFRRFLKE